MYQEWLSGSSPQFLRIVGPPGAGKTTVFDFLVKELQNMAQDRSMMVAHYDCSRKSYLQADPAAVARELLYQLLSTKPSLFKLIQRALGNRWQPMLHNIRFLWNVLDTLLARQEYAEIFILIDALDECDQAEEFTRALHHSALSWTQKGTKVKFLITYRPAECLNKLLNDVGLNLRIEDNISADLNRYIDTSVGTLSRQKKLPLNLVEDLSRALQQNANGMFLWVSRVLRVIEQAPAVAAIRRILHDLPESISYLYTNLFYGIEPKYHDDALSLLRWIVSAQRPMTIDELAVALAMGDRHLDPDIVFSEDAIKKSRNFFWRCNSLVQIDPKDETLRLVHPSARD